MNEPMTSIDAFRKAYDGGASPAVVAASAAQRARTAGDHAFIYVPDESCILEQADRLVARRVAGETLPLFGIPFGVKDNIDVEGMPTTAACPSYLYRASRSARSVEKLIDAGAICIGKTNLDQFATGLCGVRSPYGACASVANPAYVSGGSSSGSAVAVAAGHVCFALGTDTGGSGRIPAGFNGIVGIKPTVGRISTRGLVPNCPSLDCVSIFAHSVGDGRDILQVIDGFDPADPYARKNASQSVTPVAQGAFRFGRLRPSEIETFGMPDCADLYERACRLLIDIGGEPVEIDFALFRDCGSMLFDGPWIAERKAALKSFVERQPEALMPVIGTVLDAADMFDAVSVFASMQRLAVQKRVCADLFSDLATIVFPTAPRPFTIEAMEQDPVRLNNRLGYYTYSANLLDLCGVSVANARLACGVPMGITLLAPAWHDETVMTIAGRFESHNVAN